MDYAQAAAAAAEQRNQAAKATAVNSTSDEQDATQLTCDVLCSLGAVASPSAPASTASNHNHNNNYCHGNLAGIPHEAMALDPNPCTKGGKSPSLSACPKQHQLPMFLSSK